MATPERIESGHPLPVDNPQKKQEDLLARVGKIPELRTSWEGRYAKVSERRTSIGEKIISADESLLGSELEVQEMVKLLTEKFGKINDGKNFDVFLSTFDKIDISGKKQIIDLVKNKGKLVSEYFTEEGFPNNQTIQKFYSEFGIKIEETRISKVSTLMEEGNVELKKLLNLREKFLAKRSKFEKAGFSDFMSVLEKIDAINNLDMDDANKLQTKLSVIFGGKGSLESIKGVNISYRDGILKGGYLNTLSPDEFNKLMQLIREIDKEEGKEGTPDSLYAQMVAMSASSPELKAKFTLFEKTYLQPTQTTKPTTLTDAERGAILGSGNFTQVGNTFQSVSGDTLKIYNPQTGAVTLKGKDADSVYKFNSDVPLGDFSEKVAAYEKVKTEHEPKLEKYSRLVDILQKLPPEVKKVSDLETYMKTSFLEHFQSFFSAIRGAFRAATGKDMTPDTPIGEVTQAVLPDFIRQRDESKKVLEEAQKKYESELQEYVTHYKEKSKEKEEKLRKILELFKDLGIDMLPNALLDTVVKQLNTSGKILQVDLGDGKKFQNKLNWKNGEMGLNEDKKDDVKDYYRRFFNMMLTGKPDEPVVLSGGSSGEVKYMMDGTIQSKDRIRLKEKYIVQAQLTPQKILKNLKVE